MPTLRISDKGLLLPGKAAESADVAESAKALAETAEALAEQGHAAAVKQPESGLPQLTLDVFCPSGQRRSPPERTSLQGLRQTQDLQWRTMHSFCRASLAAQPYKLPTPDSSSFSFVDKSTRAHCVYCSVLPDLFTDSVEYC